MRTVNTIAELRQIIKVQKGKGKSIALVPTMGNLHEGHLTLIKEAKIQADYVVASIFVNPMQFGKNEDLDAYPRTLQADSTALEAKGCDLLFSPSVREMYPTSLEEQTRVSVPTLSRYHCGASRPGHFEGVATVVTKLFNMVQPDVALFGQKDFQQLAVIKKMVSDLCLPIKIVGIATSREPSGLARSSRNGFLSAEQKLTAAKIYQLLLELKQKITANERHDEQSCNYEQLCNDARSTLDQSGFKCDYVNIANALTLAPATSEDKELVVLIAAWLGTTRLIDNITVTLKRANDQ